MNVAKRVLSPAKTRNENEIKKQKTEMDKTNCAAIEENYDFLFDDDDDEAFAALVLNAEKKALEPRLDLSVWQRCVVTELERERKTFDLVLDLRAESEPEKENEHENGTLAAVAVARCHLQAPWNQTRISVGDILSLQAVWNDKLNAFVVDKDHGYCVSNADTLISGTTVVGSLFCRRKAVLQERFRGVDANNKNMVIGSLVHEMLQTVLSKRLRTQTEMERLANELLDSPQTAYTLYASQLTREETSSEVQKFVPNIVAFVAEYFEGKEPSVVLPQTFRGHIEEVQDIEENLWVPQLGLKGKVDVSVRVRRERAKHLIGFPQTTKQQHAIPLELKTGRASFSMEHKGQLILYQMMLSANGRNVDTGLLLYLREGIMREVRGARNEQRDLIVLRNDLAYYLSRTPQLPDAQNGVQEQESMEFVQPFELPEPISHHSACGNCAYANICCSFAKTDAQLQLSESHPLRKVMVQALEHLEQRDYAYFIHWCGLLALEEQETRQHNYLRALWTQTATARQQQARAVCDLHLNDTAQQAVVTEEESRFIHTFHLDATVVDVDLTLSGFDLGEYVIISSTKRLAIAAGCINSLTRNTVSVSLERDLRQNYANETFIMDKHESQSFNVFNYTNLGLLLDNTERAGELRDIVIARKQPEYRKVLPKVVATEGAKVLQQLNAVQRAAVLKALTTDSFMLIKGLPGTGKTQTLVAIVRLLHLMGKSVLITSQTHYAVDNLLLRLLPHKLPLLRLGSNARVHAQLQQCSESVLLADCKTETELAKRYASYPIIGVTCLGSAHSIFLHRKFDYCIMDEATQVMQATALRPLFFCMKFILVGDPDQLPPIIRSREARQRGADESLFKRLDSETATAVLTLQYRMNKTITRLANDLTYHGALKCANNEVQLATMQLKQQQQLSPNKNGEKWLQRALQTHIEQSVLLLDTLDCSKRSYAFASTRHSAACAVIEQSYAAHDETANENDKSPTANGNAVRSKRRISKYTNYCDAAIVFRVVRQLLIEAACDATRIGIIAPYRAQVELLRKLIAQHAAYYNELNFAQVEVNTVDQYQGRDKDIIIYSCTKTGTVSAHDLERSHEAEILEDQRRLTVAITRSKHKLIMIGDAACLQQYAPFRQLFAHIPAVCRLQLQNEKLGFAWQTVLDELSDVIKTADT